MVKWLAIALVGLLRFELLADAILWQVNTDVYGGEFTAARVMVSPSAGSEASVLTTVYYDEETGGYTMEFPAGIGIITDGEGTYNPPSTGDQWSLITTGIDKTTASFFVELGNYELVNGLPSWTDTVATGEARTYDWLVTKHALGAGGDFDNVFWAWDGAPYVPTPEPTTGLLMMVGMAMLALRRRRAG